MDLLQFAIDMELDGEKHYRSQAEKNTANPLGVVFQLLADDEAKHAQLLRSLAKGDVSAYQGQITPPAEGNPFHDASEAVKTAKPAPEQAELYRITIEMERKSVDLYTRMYAETEDAATGALFHFLIQEENRHRDLMEELYQHVNRPNNWVESAEFGVREEY